MTIVEDYLNYVKKYTQIHGEKTLVLMQVGSFFECYAILMPDGSYKGSNIQEFASINDMIISKKNVCVGELNTVMAGFGVSQLEKYVKKMLQYNYTVVVYVQDNQAKNTTRSLACIYSPGTFFNNNDILDSENNNSGLSNNTICIWAHLSKANKIIKESILTIGLTIIDILTGKLINYEYQHQYINSPTVYDQLEKYIAIYNPCEAIIITNSEEEENLIDTIISYSNINTQKLYKIFVNNKNNKISKTKETEFETIACNCEKQKYQEALIDKIYGIGCFQEKCEFHQYPIANQSLCFLLYFIEKHNPYLVKDIDYPHFENHCNKLILANHSLKQLNIISDQRYNGKLSCVSNFLNNCITNTGKRKFNYDLLHPINDIETLNKSYNITDNLIETKFYEVIRENLNNVRDIEKIERKLIMKNINPKDFIILHNNLSKIEKLFKKISTENTNKELYSYINFYIPQEIDSICNSLNDFIESRFNLEKAGLIVIDKLSNYNLEDLDFINKNYNNELNILLKNCIDSREQFETISHYFSQLLSDFEKPKNGRTRTSSTTKNRVKKKENGDEDLDKEIIDDKENNGGNYIKIHETSKNDAMLILTKRRAMILRDCLSKLIEKNGANVELEYTSKYSKSREILILDLSSIEFKIHGNNQTSMVLYSGHINDIASSIQNSKDILVDNLTRYYNDILREFIDFNNKIRLSTISRFIGLIDVCQCRSYNAIKYNYCKPIISEFNDNDNHDKKSYVKFKKIRHCLIEHLNQKEIYISNDLELGNDINGILLYGTNAVGKTSFIKSIGISIIMAQAGMYVPCQEFIFYPYNYLFTRILGNDNIFKGLSTFAVEMCELRTILKQATKNSIILGDELCSGTESTSALSIFVSSLERLHTIESTFLFATHFHEILEYYEIKNLNKLKTCHMSVIFNREKKTLIYDRKLRDGPGEAMYGLEVCKSLDLPDDFVERAYEIRSKYNKNIETDILIAKKSRYNSKKLRDMCEICNKNPGTEIHHLQFQKNADNNGIINGEFNKNNKANLINICDSCHDKIHRNNTEYKFTKTTNGYTLQEL